MKNQFAISDLSQLFSDVRNAFSSNLKRSNEQRARDGERGDIRNSVLCLLEQTPKAGHRIARQLNQISGVGTATTGQVFAALEALVAEGLASMSIESELKTYALTEAGAAAQTEVSAESESNAHAREEASEHSSGSGTNCESDFKAKADLGKATAQLMQAVGAAAAGSTKTRIEARNIIARASKDLFQLLAADN